MNQTNQINPYQAVSDLSNKIDLIKKVLDVVGKDEQAKKVKSLSQFDACHAIRHILGEPSYWTNLGDGVHLKRLLKGNGVSI